MTTATAAPSKKKSPAFSDIPQDQLPDGVKVRVKADEIVLEVRVPNDHPDTMQPREVFEARIRRISISATQAIRAAAKDARESAGK